MKLTEEEIESILETIREGQQRYGFTPEWMRFWKPREKELEVEYAPSTYERLGNALPEFLP